MRTADIARLAIAFLTVPFCTVMLPGCDRADGDAPRLFGAATAASLETDPGVLRALATVPHVEVDQMSGPGGTPFHVATRIPHIRQYRCSLCHTRPLETGSFALEPSEARTRVTHTDIALKHAPSHVMSCKTCHDGRDLDKLRLNDGTTVSFDHAYRLCMQCHFEQGRDWAGGAHGKRLAGWHGKRVVMNCTACHDPHAPSFPVLTPEGFPKIPRTINAGRAGAH